MKYYVKDSFDMPHIDGVKATVVRLVDVVLEANLFGGYDARIFRDNGEESASASGVRIALSDPWIKHRLGLDGLRDGSACPTEDDVLLWCERFVEGINWYMVTYGYADQTN